MKIYVIEAYGGQRATNGPVHHFVVQADTAEDALSHVRRSVLGQGHGRFDVIEEADALEAAEPGIISEHDGPYVRPA
jgi:hypothetical protein